jgi:cytosine/adenosine deaminase-related metal-dependent hydrolase
VRFFPVQSMVTVVLVPPVVNAHVHVFKSATGGQRQTKGLEKEEKGFPF